MNQRLADFLIDLAENPDARAAFERDPAGSMARAGLNAAEQAAVRSRDQRQIRLLLSRAPAGRLTVVGAGIRPSHLTLEIEDAIARAGRVFHQLPPGGLAAGVQALNPRAESLLDLHAPGRSPAEVCAAIVERLLAPARAGESVCAVFHGHPGVLCYPAGAAIRQARQEGLEAVMLPGVSAEDCLYADLGLDPATYGSQSFEATDFLVHRRRFDTHSVLLLWQAGGLGAPGHAESSPDHGLAVLAETLRGHYPPDHRLAAYEAAADESSPPVIRWLSLAELPGQEFSPFTTLYVPPLENPAADPAVIARLQADAAAADGAR
jgi:hypothetical protein